MSELRNVAVARALIVAGVLVLAAAAGLAASAAPSERADEARARAASDARGARATKPKPPASAAARASTAPRADAMTNVPNRGTIKINGVPLDGARGNEPQLTCDVLELRLIKFDAGTRLAWTFERKPPTGTGEISTGSVVVTNPVEQTVRIRLSILDEPGDHHVKVTVRNLASRAAGKHKVFWIRCPDVPGTTSVPSSPPRTGGTTGSFGRPEPAPPWTPSISDAPDRRTRVRGTFRVAGGATTDASLPRTGQATRVLLLVGLALVATGAALLLEARRRDPVVEG